jgi:hypothetical protein
MNSILGHGLKYGLFLRNEAGVWVQDGPPVHNLIPQAGVEHIRSLIRGSGASPISSWYMFLFENNYVPTSGVTAADLPGVIGESTAYTEATRPAWTHQDVGDTSIDNLASLATFTMNAPKIIYGAGIVSASTKGGNTGLIISIARFDTPRELEAGMEFGVGGILTLVPTTL